MASADKQPKYSPIKFNEMNELEEKVAMLEELIQGFLKRMTVSVRGTHIDIAKKSV